MILIKYYVRKTMGRRLTPGLSKEEAYLAILPHVQAPADLRAIIDYWKPDEDADP